MALRQLVLAACISLGAASSLAQTPPPPADPGAPLSGYPRKALGTSTPAELKTATYVRDVIYGHRDGMALTYDVFKPKKANGALVVNMVSAGWRSAWAPPEQRQARYQWLIDKGFTDDIINGRDAVIKSYNIKQTNTSQPLNLYINNFISSSKNIASAAAGNSEKFYKGIDEYRNGSFTAEYKTFEVNN